MSNLNCTTLLSYPRCGNSWLRFCIEALSGKPSYPDSKFSLYLRNYISVKGDYILRKEHSLFDSDNDIDRVSVANNNLLYKKEKLILILRNFKECLIRQCQNYNDAILPKKNNFNYMENIVEFDNWPEDKRLLLYYEDLITQPKNELLKCVEFLGLDKNRLDEFMDNYKFYKEKSIYSYDVKTQLGSVTKGELLIFHSKNKTREEMKEWDMKIYEKHPDMFEKYLNRYKEGDLK